MQETPAVSPVLPPGPPRVWPSLLAFPLAFIGILVGNLVVFAVLLGPTLARALREGWKDEGTKVDIEGTLNSVMLSAGPLLLLLSGAVSFVTLVAVAGLGAKLSPRPWRQRLGFQPARPIAVVLGGLSPVFVGWSAGAALQLLGLGNKSESLKLIGDSIKATSGPMFALLALFIAVLGPFGEELLFRGYMQTRLSERWGALRGVGIASIAFAMMHLDPVHVLGVLPIGIVLGIVVQRTGSIYPALLGHILNNTVATVSSRFTATDPEAKAPISFLVVSLLLGAATLFAFFRLTKPASR